MFVRILFTEVIVRILENCTYLGEYISVRILLTKIIVRILEDCTYLGEYVFTRSRPDLELKFKISLAIKDPGASATTIVAGAGTGTTEPGGTIAAETGTSAGAGTGMTGGMAAISFSRFRSGYR